MPWRLPAAASRRLRRRASEGHYNQAPITFQDILLAKEVLKSKLRTIYHTRIQYPELKSKDSEEQNENKK